MVHPKTERKIKSAALVLVRRDSDTMMGRTEGIVGAASQLMRQDGRWGLKLSSKEVGDATALLGRAGQGLAKRWYQIGNVISQKMRTMPVTSQQMKHVIYWSRRLLRFSPSAFGSDESALKNISFPPF